jgi:hypothetical protein
VVYGAEQLEAEGMPGVARGEHLRRAGGGIELAVCEQRGGGVDRLGVRRTRLRQPLRDRVDCFAPQAVGAAEVQHRLRGGEFLRSGQGVQVGEPMPLVRGVGFQGLGEMRDGLKQAAVRLHQQGETEVCAGVAGREGEHRPV